MMGKNKLVMSIALLLVVAGGLTLMVKPREVKGQNDSQIIKEESSFKNIEVFTNNAEVEVIPTKSSEASVEYTGANKKRKYIFDVDVKGDTLSVQLKQKRRFFFSFGFHSGDLKLTVKVPEKQYKKLQVKSDNGRIYTEDLEAELVKIETDNGLIHLKNVEAKTIDVETDNGEIVLDQVKGKVKGSTDNGEISMIANDIEWPIDLSTDNGSISVKMISEPKNATIDAKTDNGKVTIYGDKDNFVKYGKGKYLLKLRTDNGPITVTK